MSEVREPRIERYRELVWKLFVLVRAVESQPLRAAATAQAAAECKEALDTCLAVEPQLLVQERGGHLYANGVRLPIDLRAWAGIEGLVERLHGHGLLGVSFDAGAAIDDLLCVAGALAGENFARAGLTHAALLARVDAVAGTLPCASRLASVFLARRLVACVDLTSPPEPAEKRRILSIVADEIARDPAALVAFEALESDAAALRRAVATCVRAVVLGVAIGMPEHLLRELAVATLLAPVGLEKLVATLGTSDGMLRAILASGEPEGLVGAIVRVAARAGSVEDLVEECAAASVA